MPTILMDRIGRRRFVLILGALSVLGSLSLDGLARQAQAPARVPTFGTSAISGVLVDGNTGQPVAGAIVAIVGGDRGTQPAGATRMLTDASGRFVFSRLPAGSYSLSASKIGYLSSRFGQSDPSINTMRAIRVAEGEAFTKTQMTIWRPGAISGTVLDEAGEPVVGVLVRVVTQVMIAGRPQLASGLSARTDDRGRYRAAGLYSGRYVVMIPSVQASVPADVTPAGLAGYQPAELKAAQDAGRVLPIPDDPALVIGPAHRLIVREAVAPSPPAAAGWSYPVTFAPAARTIGSAALIELRPGEERSGVNVQLTPVRVVRISGRLDGPPDAIAGMTVRLLPEGNESLGFGAETATALAGPDGAFTLFNVPTGRYTIIASRSTMNYVSSGSSGSTFEREFHPPGARMSSGGSGAIVSGSQGVSYRYQNQTGPVAYSARMPLDVGTQGITDLSVPMTRGITLAGSFVVEEGTSAAVVLRSGMPVYAEPANGDASLGMLMRTANRDDPLSFQVDGLLSGPYLLRTLGISGVVKSIEWEGRDFTNRPFDGSIGRDIRGVVITVTSKIASITGNVRGAGSEAAAEGSVIIFPTDKSQWTNYGFRPTRLLSAAVSTAGAYSIRPVPAGEFFIVAVPAAQSTSWQDPRFLEAASRVASRITLDWGSAVTQDLTIKSITVER
jgi:hypothetical protein